MLGEWFASYGGYILMPDIAVVMGMSRCRLMDFR